MADSLRISRAVVLIGYLASFLGLVAVTVVAFRPSPVGWSWYDVTELVSLSGYALFYGLFGWAFWVWLPRLAGGSSPAPTARLALRLLAAASLLFALAYSAETYQLTRFLLTIRHTGKAEVVSCLGYGVMALGFAIAAVGFWVASLTFDGASDDADGSPSRTLKPQLMRAQALVIVGGLVVGATGVIVLTWIHRISYTGAIAKSQVIIGCATALALVMMAVSFAALLVDQQGQVARGIRAPLSLLGLAFVALAAGNLVVGYEAFRPFPGATEWDVRIGYVLQSAGALATAMGFFAAAWKAPSPQTEPIDHSPVAGGQPELVATH